MKIHNQTMPNEFEQKKNELNNALRAAQTNGAKNQAKTSSISTAQNVAQTNPPAQTMNPTSANQSIPQTTQNANQANESAQTQTNTQTQSSANTQTQNQSTSSGYAYDKNADYTALINQAVANGNYQQAAIYEQQRNAKIVAEGLSFEQTSQYADYLPGGAKYGTIQTTANDMSPLINKIFENEAERIRQDVNYETQGAVDQLNRALQDAQPSYEAALANQLLETKQAQDAQALRNQVNGDRGGIGSAQVSSIGNTGAKNREAIAQQQRQLATDTARQIADLRAQGKYREASLLLQNTQQKLSALYDEQVRIQQQQTDEKNILIELGTSYLSSGVMPSAEMLSAMGIDANTAQRYVDFVRAQTQGQSSGSGGGSTGDDSVAYFDKASADNLSANAMAVANSLAKSDVANNQNSNLEKIMSAYDSKAISAAEAAYLLWTVGIGDGGYNEFIKTLEVWNSGKSDSGNGENESDFGAL